MAAVDAFPVIYGEYMYTVNGPPLSSSLEIGESVATTPYSTDT
jgi:hypothetical protein